MEFYLFVCLSRENVFDIFFLTNTRRGQIRNIQYVEGHTRFTDAVIMRKFDKVYPSNGINTIRDRTRTLCILSTAM